MKGSVLKILLLVLITFGLATAKRQLCQRSGDLIFVSPNLHRPNTFTDAILETGNATIKWMLKNGYNIPTSQQSDIADHVAICLNTTTIIEAIPMPGVHLVSTEQFLQRTAGSLLFKAKIIDQQIIPLIPRFLQAVPEVLGHPYAHLFQPPSSGKFYCSSLVTWGFGQAANASNVLGFANFGMIFEPMPFWVNYYHQYGSNVVPVGDPGSNPALVLHAPWLVYEKFQN